MSWASWARFFKYYLTFAISAEVGVLLRWLDGGMVEPVGTMARLMTGLMFVRPGDLYGNPIELDVPRFALAALCTQGGLMTDKTAASVRAEKDARRPLELVQEGAELRPARPTDFSHASLRLGIDVGSTTVKLAVIDDNDNLVYANYERHHTDVRATARQLFSQAREVIGDAPMRVSITGSGGMLLAKWLDLEFVQEVIASKRAVETLIPQTDVAIELGGEDAKIIYFDNGIEQRMNGTCAGGTGAFIDQMASLLHTDASGLNELAKGATQIHPIASRCGVFAKSDVQPLLNEGAAPADIAASIFQAVADQTVSGLACGHPIRGHVAFLGGPLQYLLGAAPPLLPHAQARRRAHHRAEQRAPLRRHGRRARRRVREARDVRAGHRVPRAA